jgi:hypothetical protein
MFFNIFGTDEESQFTKKRLKYEEDPCEDRVHVLATTYEYPLRSESKVDPHHKYLNNSTSHYNDNISHEGSCGRPISHHGTTTYTI